MTDSETVTRLSRKLRDVLEPVTGQVYFSPECHAAYERLGFSASPAASHGVALPDGPAYFTSRGSVMGQVEGDVVAAAFAVFNPAIVAPMVAAGWKLTDAPTICAARTAGATAQLVRVLGEDPAGLAEATDLLERAVAVLRPEGRPLYSGVRSQPRPDHPVGAMWWLGDQIREYRGDSHTIAWAGAGLDATEIGLLSELYWGLPPRTYVRTRAWSDAELDAAQDRLSSRGLLAGDEMSPDGREFRAGIEQVTDEQMRPLIDALGDGIEDLIATLEPWATAVVDAYGYPRGAGDLTNMGPRE